MGDSSLPKIAGYRILEKLGEGSMGVVWLAETEARPPTRVALKLLHPKISVREKEVLRFQREARLGGALRHPNILPVIDCGEWEGGRYLVMEHVAGHSLAQIIAAENARRSESRAGRPARAPGPEDPPLLSLADKLALLARVADALHYAHENGVVHRDVKPANILIRPDGHPFLIDFGLARNLSLDPTLTSSDVVMGTPWYMSPEQVAGEMERVDLRTDIYALGVTVFEAVTGRRPFHSENFIKLRDEIQSHEPPSLRRLAPHAPPELERVVLKAMEKKPQHRYPDAAELRKELLSIAAGSTPSAWGGGLFLRRQLRWFSRKRLVLAGVAVLLLTLAVTWISVRRHRDALIQERETQAARLRGDAFAALSDANDIDTAIKKLQEAASLATGSTLYHLELAAVYGSCERLKEANAEIAAAIQLGFDVEVSGGDKKDKKEEYDRGLYWMAQSKYDKAAEAFGSVLALDPEYYPAHFQLYMVHRVNHEPDLAAAALRAYLKKAAPTGSPQRVLAEAQLLELEGKLSQAIDLLEAYLGQPGSLVIASAVHRHLGRVYLQRAVDADPDIRGTDPNVRQDLERARTELLRSDEESRLVANDLLNLATASRRLGERQDARSYALKALAKQSDLVGAHVLLIGMRINDKDWDGALADLESAPGSVKTDADFRKLHAYVARRAAEQRNLPEERDERLRLIELALERDPACAEADLLLANSLWSDGRIADALEHLDRAASHWNERFSEKPSPMAPWDRSPFDQVRLGVTLHALRIHAANLLPNACSSGASSLAALKDYLLKYPDLTSSSNYGDFECGALLNAVEVLASQDCQQLHDCDLARRLIERFELLQRAEKVYPGTDIVRKALERCP